MLMSKNIDKHCYNIFIKCMQYVILTLRKAGGDRGWVVCLGLLDLALQQGDEPPVPGGEVRPAVSLRHRGLVTQLLDR